MSRTNSLAQKRVVITGASAGIGAAAALAFSQAGAKVVLAARSEERLHAVAAQLPGESLVVPVDLAEPQAAAALVAAAEQRFGGIDILVNNAGVGLAAPVAQLPAEELLAAMQVNVFAPLALTQAALPSLRRSGGQVLVVSSVVGLRALPYLGGYAATKAALDRLVESLRVEMRGSGVAITLVRPGTTNTRFSESRLGSGHEQRRFGNSGVPPEKVAQVLVRAAQRRQREIYVRFGDWLNTGISLLAPKLVDRLLGWSFRWQDGENH